MGGIQPTNYLSTIDSLHPDVPGITLKVVDLGTRLQLTNTTAHDVVVLGYDGEPYLRVGPRGVFQNARSPATYINRTLNLANAQAPPKSADPTAPPKWEKLGSGDTVRWHDHNAHYMGTSEPPVVQRDHDHRHVIDKYTVEMRWNGQDVVARGRIVWVPPPSPWPYAGIAVVLAAVVVWATRTRMWARVFAAALVVLVVCEVLHVTGLYGASTDSFGTKSFASLYSVAGILLALLALGWMWRKGADSATPLVLLASMFLFIAGGLADVTSLAKSQIPSTWSDGFARMLVTITLGVGLGTAIGAAWRLVPAKHGTTPTRPRRRGPRPRPRPATDRLPVDLGAARVVLGLHLDGRVRDVVLQQEHARLVEHGMRIGALRDHHVCAGHFHLGRERPHVEVVHVDDAGDRREVVADAVQLHVRGRDLEQHAQRARGQAPRTREDPDADRDRDDRVDGFPPGDLDHQRGHDHADRTHHVGQGLHERAAHGEAVRAHRRAGGGTPPR